MHTCTGKAVAGSGDAKVPPPQNFQSLFGIVSPTVMMPFTVSVRCTFSVAPLLSDTLTGKYGIGLPITLRGAAFMPLRLTMRPRILPVTPLSTGTLTHSLVLGATGVSDDALAGTLVAG